jgi:hypothetical protein
MPSAKCKCYCIANAYVKSHELCEQSTEAETLRFIEELLNSYMPVAAAPAAPAYQKARKWYQCLW